MLALLSFLHRCFIRSYRFGPPLLVFISGIVFIYSVVPNPIMESYAFSISFLFVIASTISYVVIDIEAANQEAVTTLHVGSFTAVNLGKLLYSWLFVIPLAIFAVLYPALFDKFVRAPSLEELTMALLYHVGAAWLAVSLACWFSSKLIASRLTSFLLLSLLIVLVLCAQPLRQALPELLQSLVWLLPPLDKMIYLLFQYNEASVLAKWLVLGAPLLYGSISAGLFLRLLHKRRLG